VPKNQKLALTYGGATHAGLFEFYSGSTENECLKAFMQEAMKEGSKIAKYAEDAVNGGNPAEYSMEFGVGWLMKYMKQHPLDKEDFQPLKDGEGKPFLEVGFCVELESGLYLGKIDGIGSYRTMPAIIEHKTTKRTPSEYLKWMNPNNQITGYLKAVKDYLDYDVAKCVVNVLRVKDFKRGDPEDNDQKLFVRGIAERTPQQIDARMRQINLQIALIKKFLEIGVDAFYMNAPWACNAFGECEYKPICNLDGGDAEMIQMIVQGGYRKEEWHPYDTEPKRMLK